MREEPGAPGDGQPDCEAGRRRGCQTFCCRLVVRLSDAEAERHGGPTLPKGPDGWCAHLDRASHRCAIWEDRPAICREYDCNEDPNLQVVLRDGFQSLVQLATARPPLPLEHWVQIPARGAPKA